MLNITIDSSMLTGKNNIRDCELTVNIAGCAWDADENIPLPCFKLPQTFVPPEGETPFEANPAVIAMMDFFYPWRWDQPNQLVLQWLDINGNEITDAQGNIIEEIFPINLDGYDQAKFGDDKKLVQEHHYEAMLNKKLIKFTTDGKISFNADSCLELNGKEIRYVLGKVGDIEIENKPDLTKNTGFLNMCVGKFAQKLSPLNLGLNLTFFGKGANITLPNGAEQFVVYLKSDDVNNRWNVVSDNNNDRQVKTFQYFENNQPKMILHSLITPIPMANDKSNVILLRDTDGNFLGNTKIKVSDSEELLNKKTFKEKIIRKTISIFDLPGLLHKYLEANRTNIVNIANNPAVNFSEWCEQVKKLFIILLRDAYSIGNKLNSENSLLILKDLAKRYNDSIENKSEQIELTIPDIEPTSPKDIFDQMSVRDENLSFNEWRRIIDLSKVLFDRLNEINVPAQTPDAINDWLSLWKVIVSNQPSTNESDPQNEIIKEKNNLLKRQIIDVVNSNFFSNSESSKKLFGEVADYFFENYNPANLFIESIAININGNNDLSQFQTAIHDAIKKVLVETCLKDYVVQRKTGNQLFPSIVDVLKVLDNIPFAQSGQIFWDSFTDFSVNFTNIDSDLDTAIDEFLKDNVDNKVTDIPPNILIKVDDIETQDDLSDEISGHLLLIKRAKDINEPVSSEVEWKSLNWSKINLINKPKGQEFKLKNNYLIPSFLPLTDDLKNFYLTLSNERLSLTAGEEIFNDQGDNSEEDSNFQLKYLFDNGSAQQPNAVPAAYALWYGFNYDFAGFIALNSGVLAKALRTDDWVTFNINNGQKEIEPYVHLRRVPFSKIYSEVFREKSLPVLPIPEGLLTITSELEENNKVDENNTRKELPVYLLFDNQINNKQKVVNIKLGKPLTNFWNWYAWNGNKLTNPQLQTVLNEEVNARGNPDIRNEILHDPALENKLFISVDQIFPTPKSEDGFILNLRETKPGDILTKIENGLVKIELSSNDKVNVDKINHIVKIPPGFVVKISVRSLTNKKHFDGNTKRFHDWMTKILDSQSPIKIDNTNERYYLTKPVEMIFETAKLPYDNEKKPLVIELEVWDALDPFETEHKQIAVNLVKKHRQFAYFSRTTVDHQVWNWNGRLSESLLKNATADEATEFPKNLNPKLSANVQPDVDNTEIFAETNYAMTWEAWEFSDRPDSSALRHTTNLKVVKPGTKDFEKQTIFTDSRQVDEKALYYRFSAELFGRYELLGGEYIGSVRSAVSISDKESNDKKPVENQWKRFFKPSRKTARLPKPSIRFIIPLTSSIDECQKHHDIRSASLMIVMNDRWFSEMGLAEKCEIGIELLKYPFFSNSPDAQNHYLNAGLDPIISGKRLNPVDLNKEGAGIYIEKPEAATGKIDEENPVAVFTPEGPAGLTYDFATATPKLISSTFILKVDNINQFISENQQMNPWSMVQIAARRNVHKPLWELDNENFSSVILNFCKLDSEKAELEILKIGEDFIDVEKRAEFIEKLNKLRLYFKDNQADDLKFKETFNEIIGQYNLSEKRKQLETDTFKGIKSEWTAKEWVQFIPDINSIIPLQWKRENTVSGFVSFQPSDGKVIKPEFAFDFPTLSSDEESYEAKTERYLVISEKTQNAGGQPVEKYKATYMFNKVAKHFELNDSADISPDFSDFGEGYARIISVRVSNVPNGITNIWEKLFGENKERTVSFKDIQDDPQAALPLISKRFSVRLKN